MLTFLIVLFVVVCVFLVIIILLQAGKGAGMGIFGGGSASTFGAASGDILTKITTVLGFLFLGLALLIAWMVSRDQTVSGRMLKDQKPTEVNKNIFAPGSNPETNTFKLKQIGTNKGADDKNKGK